MRSSGTLRFWIAFSFLNAVAGEHFPQREPWWAHLLPSVDVLLVLVVLACGAAWQWRLPRFVYALLVLGFLITRLLRIADGISQVAYLKDFRLSTELPLLPEFVRLFHNTWSSGRFVLALCLTLLSLGLLTWCVARALSICERELARHGRAWAFGMAALAAVAAFEPETALFRSSIAWRLSAELGFARRLPSYRAAELQRIAAVQRTLALQPHDLAALRGSDVFVFLIESYGACALRRPALFQRIRPVYAKFEQTLGAMGFQIASNWLDAPTYGGRSWLAQATLITGVPVRDPLEFELLRAAQPQTLADAFGRAGYHTVLVQPGTVRDDAGPDLFHFERHYFARDLGYRGPRFGWATMPDQYALAAVRAREQARPTRRPTFALYALVSSHVPWSDLPALVDDWSLLADGSLYRALPSRHYASGWLSLTGADEAYADSIAYDLELLRRYIAQFVADDALLIVLGDHQPHSDVTRRSPSAAVPIHVLSKNREFIARFLARGYTPGMQVQDRPAPAGLDSLMLDLLSDFSTKASAP